MRFHRGFVFVFLFVVSFSVNGQKDIQPDTLSIKEAPDSLLTIKKNRLSAAGLIFATNMSVWSLDRFIIKGEYAYINGKTIERNFKTGFVWDNDMFVTNLFAHPYHGGLYFNAARSNGMNFWESVPFAAGGSLMWEFFMENESPAINDFLSTSIGGASLGEMTYRISDMLVDERSMGFNRFGREALLTLISPVRGVNRLISGRAWKHSRAKGNVLPATPVAIYAALGHRIIADFAEENQEDVSNMLSIDFGLDYGNPYDPDNDQPYDFFSLKMSGNLFSRQPLIGRVNAIGMLFAKEIDIRKQDRQLTFGFFQHFNYYESRADIKHVHIYPYKLSEAASLGPGLLYKTKKKHVILYGSAYLSAILLGGSQTDHYHVDDRDYNMGSGFSSKLNLEIQFGEKARLSFNSEDYRLYSWVGYDINDPEEVSTSVQGDKGNASLSVARLCFNYVINKHFLLSLESSFYYRSSVYTSYPDIEHGVTENKVGAGYLF
jgi:hypothetical protein